MQFLSSICIRCFFTRLIRFSPSSLSQIQIFLNFHPSSCPITRFQSKTLEESKAIPSPRFSTKSSSTNTSSTLSESQNPVDFDHKSVEETLTSYTNDWVRAFEFFNWVENECQLEHNVETYNRMIDILGKFFEFDLAWSLIDRMGRKKIQTLNHVTFRIMFKRYAMAHMVKEAIDTFNRLDEFGLKDEISFSNLIDVLCDCKHVIEAEELCMSKNSISPFGVNTKLYNMMLRGWLKMGWWSKCREFWEDMERKGIARDLHTYTIYMDIVCKSGKPWKAVKLYKEMKNKRIQLDVVAYNTVIHAIGLSEGVHASIRLHREMLELGCKPNIVTYNTIMKLLCQAGQLGQAYSLLAQMPGKGCEPNVLTYHCLFGCLTRPKEILRLFDRMIESGVCPRMDTYVMLLRKFGRWGFLRPVFIVWKKMEEHGCCPDEFAYNALIDALIQKGMIDMARKYDEEMYARGLSPKLRKELGTKPWNEVSVGD